MENDIELYQNYNLTRLQKYLNYEISSSILYFLSFQIFLFIFLALGAAIIFTPFMIYVLFKENKKGWLIFFVVIILIPIILLVVSSMLFEFNKALLLITLGFFYFYCFLLRIEVNEWVKEYQSRNQYLIEKKIREEELKSFMNKFENK